MSTRSIAINSVWPHGCPGGQFYGDFLIPEWPASRSAHSEKCARDVFHGEYSYLRNAVEDVHTIVDVGCNVGAFVVWACHVGWPGQITSVRAYDPNSDAIAIARSNIRHASALSNIDISVENYAVTAGGVALFEEHDNWGSSRTHGVTSGVMVPVRHPKYLPAADILKCDAEGVDLEVFQHYPHWASVKIALFEWHEDAHRIGMFDICRQAGLTLRKNDCGESSQGVACFVRP
jgi:FkbM family methyltransferase